MQIRTYRVFLALLVPVLFAACATTEEKTQAQSEPVNVPAAPEPPVAQNEPEENTVKQIYFDFDSTQIKDQYIGTLKDHVEYLKSHVGVWVTLEGHTDAPGPENYNKNLGEKRAQAVKAFLLQNGIDAQRINIVSYGEAQPAMPAEGKATENRRVEIIYSASAR